MGEGEEFCKFFGGGAVGELFFLVKSKKENGPGLFGWGWGKYLRKFYLIDKGEKN